MIEIEKGVPLPTTEPVKCRKYPYTTMEIGDSFLVTDRTPEAVGSSASQMGKRLNRKFRSAKTREGVRVWRIA